MKKQLLALAIGSMVVAPSVAMADKGPTVYGKVNVSYENQDNGAEDQWELESNASRIGVKGELDLDIENVVAIYQAEFQVDVDDGNRGGSNSSPFSQRNIFGGFKHSQLGTLKAGKFDTPFKVSQGKVDQFGDLRGDINEIVGGSERPSNIIQYSSPKLVDVVSLNLAMIPGEGDEDFADRRDGVADGFSTSVVFDNGMLYASLGYDSEIETNLFDLGGDTLVDALHVAAKLNINNFELGALFQQSENSDSAFDGGDFEDTTYIVSAAVKLDRWKLKAQYGMTDLDTLDDDLTLMALGADYKVGKSSKVFGYFANVEADNGIQDDTTFGIGFEHNFSM
ncbi:porin [Marinobacter shengliensis]|uniref:porin n=1 Tax=Marinobacter shengliensis TaxID=1389223 RepID=UPI001108610C|nr:porin [Marinobacter shengliensis]